MRDVVIAGADMTAFGKLSDRTVKSLFSEAVDGALRDAGASEAEVGFIYASNVVAGLLQGQESIRGQVFLAETGLGGVPLINVENACASGATAFNQAVLAVGSGTVEVALAVGVEKLHVPDRTRSFRAMQGAVDQDDLDQLRTDLGARDDQRSMFMDIYARYAEWYMERTDATPIDFATVAAKNYGHGSGNPKAQNRKLLTVDEILEARTIAGCLTLPMCPPIGDGAAAILVTSRERAERWGARWVRVLATSLVGGARGTYGQTVPRAARAAYDAAGVEPSDVDVVECHDATAPAELIALEDLALAEAGGAGALTRSGATRIGGRMPVNPSGGLLSKGHPLGASGLAQLVELSDQLRGRCGERQVDGARIALAENAGGYLGPDVAAAVVTILSAP